jgi:Glycosyl hydrolase family 79 C-terminal beta domain
VATTDLGAFLQAMLRAITALALALAAGAFVLPAGASPRAHPPKVLTVGGPTTGRPIPPGFLGLSLEYWAVPDYAGPNARRVNPLFLQLIRNLAGGSAPELRIGGVTTDNTWWPVPGERAPAGVTFSLTRHWISTIGAVAAKLDARVILGINLEADSARIAAAEARALVAGVGRRRVEALELGNEPELYGVFTWGFSGAPGRPKGWDFARFEPDFARIGAALPGFPLAGPTVGQPNWFGYLRPFLATQPRVAVATLHRYPLQQCFLSPNQVKYPSVPHLLAPAASRGLADSVAAAVRVAHAHHVALRIDEMNTLSCGDVPVVAQSFASALWSLDVLFEMARVGVDGVNIHTFPGATYELFTFRRVHGRWRAAVAPDYYGLAMFARAAPAGSRLLKVSPTGSRQLKAWAVQAPDHTIRVVLINEGTRARRFAVRVGSPSATATLERLEAPGLLAQSGVTLAGQHFGAATGMPAGRLRTSTVARTRNGYLIGVPAASAAILTVPSS